MERTVKNENGIRLCDMVARFNRCNGLSLSWGVAGGDMKVCDICGLRPEAKDKRCEGLIAGAIKRRPVIAVVDVRIEPPR